MTFFFGGGGGGGGGVKIIDCSINDSISVALPFNKELCGKFCRRMDFELRFWGEKLKSLLFTPKLH